jgi:hypothetical protein
MYTTAITYEIGEEVVVRLACARVFDPRRGEELRERRLPPWTIARVIHCDAPDSPRRYALSFQHRHVQYLCSVDASAIDGIA